MLVVGVMFSVPLVKSLRKEMPDRLPGEDTTPLVLQLPDETGAAFELASVRGRIVVLTSLPLANSTARDETFDGIRTLRKRLRGLADAVHYVVLCKGGDAAALSVLLDKRHARKPTVHYVLDAEGRELDRLRKAAGAPSAVFLLLDRYSRVRGVYADTPSDLDRLVTHTGQLANWPGQDPPPAR